MRKSKYSARKNNVDNVHKDNEKKVLLLKQLTEWYDDANNLKLTIGEEAFEEAVDSVRAKAKKLKYDLEPWIKLLIITRAKSK